MFTPKHFRHIDCWSALGSVVQVYNPGMYNLNQDVLLSDDAHKSAREIAMAQSKQYPVVMLSTPPMLSKISYSLTPTCVSVVKYIIGLHLLCLTPYGFYKALLRYGATDVGYLAHGRLDYHSDKMMELING